MTRNASNIIAKMEAFLSKYAAAPTEYYLVASLWAAMTHLYRQLDTVPYLCVTSLTKRSGKTLFAADLLRPLCHKPINATAMTASTLYRKLDANNGGVLFADEAETMASESSNKLRSVLNIGYKRGQTVSVTVPGGDVQEFPVFGPKCFILIGDVNDTLRDRSIVMYMRRATPERMMQLTRFVSTVVETEALQLVTELGDVIAEKQAEILNVYRTHAGLTWLPARDAEIWLSLFAICQVICPERMDELTRAATDMAADKSQDVQAYSAEAARNAEKLAERAEFCVRLIRDLSDLAKGQKYILSDDAVTALKNIPTGPWRRYKGRGINDQDIGYLLPTRLLAKNIKVASKPKQIVRRGWMKKDLDAALANLNALVAELE